MTVPQAAFAAEFALARQIGAAQVRAKAALAGAAALRERLTGALARAPAAKQPDYRADIARLDSLTDLPRPDARNSIEPAPGPIEALHDIELRLAKLLQAVDGADGAPTPDDRAGFAQATSALDAATTHLAALQRRAS